MIKIGVIGCGHWGPNHIRIFSNQPNTKVVSCSDLSDDRLKAIKALYENRRFIGIGACGLLGAYTLFNALGEDWPTRGAGVFNGGVLMLAAVTAFYCKLENNNPSPVPATQPPDHVVIEMPLFAVVVFPHPQQPGQQAPSGYVSLSPS